MQGELGKLGALPKMPHTKSSMWRGAMWAHPIRKPITAFDSRDLVRKGRLELVFRFPSVVRTAASEYPRSVLRVCFQCFQCFQHVLGSLRGMDGDF